MHVESHDIRPPSMLETPLWSREMLRGGRNPFLTLLRPAGLDGSDLPVAYGEHNGEAGKQDQECTLTPPRQRP